eukprot:637617-Prymnesium_polylepis.1
MIPSGPDGLGWSRLIPVGPERSRAVPSGPEWSHMAHPLPHAIPAMTNLHMPHQTPPNHRESIYVIRPYAHTCIHT